MIRTNFGGSDLTKTLSKEEGRLTLSLEVERDLKRRNLKTKEREKKREMGETSTSILIED